MLSYFLAVTLVAVVVGQPMRIDNSIARPEIVYKVPESMFQPKCVVEGKKLDLLFIVDSSGSLKSDFPSIINVIKRIIDHIAIGPDATRVALTQYSGRGRTEFQFNEVSYSGHVLERFKLLKPLNGLTRTDIGLLHAMKELDPAKGMRGPEVPKVIFLVTDGRSVDPDEDIKAMAEFRAKFPTVNIWAYGTGFYADIDGLIRYTGDKKNILTKADIDIPGRVEGLFSDYRGEERCEKAPVCVPGSDKPLDLIILLDSSSSNTGPYDKMKKFVVEEILDKVTIHPKAVRMALIQYASYPTVEWDFDDTIRKEPMIRDVKRLIPYTGTTGTSDALKEAHSLIIQSKLSGARNSTVKKLAIIFSDGHASPAPGPMAKRLRRNPNLEIFGIALGNETETNFDELNDITGTSKNVYKESETEEFRERFSEYYGFNCPAVPDYKFTKEDEVERSAVQVTCTANSVHVDVRTRKDFDGQLFANEHFDNPNCVQLGDGTDKVALLILDGQCGLRRKQQTFQNDGRSGYLFEGQLTLQFHKEVVTGADQAIKIDCFHEDKDAVNNDLDNLKLQDAQQVQCDYTLRDPNKHDCVMLDAVVGDYVNHYWSCDTSSNIKYLIHDCFAATPNLPDMPLIDSSGCSVEEFLMGPVNYTKLPEKAFSESSVFKFKEDTSIKYKCKVSLCDVELNKSCGKMIPPKCNEDARRKREVTSADFLTTLNVETRTINVIVSRKLMSNRGFESFC